MAGLSNQTKTFTIPQKSFYFDLSPNQNDYFLIKNDLIKRNITLGKFIIKPYPRTISPLNLRTFSKRYCLNM